MCYPIMLPSHRDRALPAPFRAMFPPPALVCVGLWLAAPRPGQGPNPSGSQILRQLPTTLGKYFNLGHLIGADLECVTC